MFDWNKAIARFAEKVDLKKLTGLVNQLNKVYQQMSQWTPGVSKAELGAQADNLQEQIIALMKKAGVTHMDTGKFSISIRKVPTFFELTSKARLISALKAHNLSRFLIPDFSIDMKGLKEYLLATDRSMPGLRRVDDKDSLYIYSKQAETFESFLEHDSAKDPGLKSPKDKVKALWFDLRILGNVAYPRLSHGQAWGDWTLDEVKKRFALIIDILRSKLKFPIPEEPEETSSWWKLYHLAKPLMKTSPPSEDEIPKWNEERAKILGQAAERLSEPIDVRRVSNLPGIYLVDPHGWFIWNGDKSLIVKSKEFASETHEPLLLVSGKKCYGVIKLLDPMPIENQEDFLALHSEHMVSDEDRKAWWNDHWPLWAYPFTWIERFEKPVDASIPHGIQTFIDAGHVKLEV